MLVSNRNSESCLIPLNSGIKFQLLSSREDVRITSECPSQTVQRTVGQLEHSFLMSWWFRAFSIGLCAISIVRSQLPFQSTVIFECQPNFTYLLTYLILLTYSVRFIPNALYSSMFLNKREEEGEAQVHLCSFCTSRIEPTGTLRATSRLTDTLNNCLVQPMSFKAQTRKLAEGKRGESGGKGKQKGKPLYQWICNSTVHTVH